MSDDSPEARTRRWRAHAAELPSKAALAPNPATKSALLSLADDWERIAETAIEPDTRRPAV